MDFIKYKIEDIIISIKTGKTPSTKEKLYFDGDIPWITPSDLKGQKTIAITERTISELALLEKEAVIFEKDTIIVSTIGDIGKACILDKPMSCNQQLSGILVKQNIILPDLFFYWILKNYELLNFKANKSIIPILNNKIFKNISITIPKLLEDQRKIVAQLDQIQNLIDYKIKSVQTISLFLNSTFFEMFGDPANNPKNFKLKRLNEIVEKDNIITYGIVQPGKYIENGIPYIKIGDLKNGYISKNDVYKTSEEISFRHKRTICKENDIIISIRVSIGNVARITKEFVGYNLVREIALIRPNEKIIDSIFLYQILSTGGFKFLLAKHVKGSTRKGISLTKLRDLKIPIPEKKMQIKFSNLFYLAEKQKQTLMHSQYELEKLFQSILHTSFSENTKINEESIFSDLIKQFSTNDLKEKKERLQYLINLFSANKLNNVESYNDAKEKLFELLDEEVIEQSFDGDNININVK